jgi:hypothetical protein
MTASVHRNVKNCSTVFRRALLRLAKDPGAKTLVNRIVLYLMDALVLMQEQQ